MTLTLNVTKQHKNTIIINNTYTIHYYWGINRVYRIAVLMVLSIDKVKSWPSRIS